MNAESGSDPGRNRALITAGAAVLAGAGSAGAYAYRRTHRAPWAAPDGSVVQTSSLSVRVLGATGPPVLLLHGLVASGVFWGHAYDRLAHGRRLVVPDLLGFGRSPHPASGYAPDDHVAAIVGCLDELGIDEPVVIGAHSLGTLIALRLAVTHPQRVAGIAAFGPPLYPDAVSARAHVTATSPMARLFVLPGRAAEMACDFVCNHRRLAARLAVLAHPSLPREIAADAVEHTWASYSQTLQMVILAAEASQWFAQLTAPVHFVAGEDDPVVDHAYLRQVVGIHRGFTLSEWRGDHNLPLTNPDACVTLIESVAAGIGHRFGDLNWVARDATDR